MARKKISDPAYHCLLRALTLSMAIHAVILLAVVRVLPARMDMPTVTIKVALRSDANQATLRPASKPLLPAPALLPLIIPRQAATQPAVRKTPVVALALPRAPVTSAEALLADSAGAATNAPGTIASSATSIVPAAPRDGLNADDLRQYRLALAVAARRFKRYPVLARERGWEGAAEVTVTFNAHLPVPEVVLASSSGHPVLDRQAQEMMTQAARMAFLPANLRGRDFRIVVPVQFSLDGDQ